MKIGLCGTMSVGKTTLVNALKKEPEFKNYTFRTERSKHLSSMGIPSRCKYNSSKTSLEFLNLSLYFS